VIVRFSEYFGILVAAVAAWLYLGLVRAGSNEAIIAEDRYSGH